MNYKFAGIVCMCMTGAVVLWSSPVHAEEKQLFGGLFAANTEQAESDTEQTANLPLSQDSIVSRDSIKKSVAEPVGAATLLASEKTKEEYVETANQAAGSFWGYTDLGIANVDNHLNIRQSPSEDGKLVGKLPINGACEIISEENGWTQIRSGKVEGYVKSEFLLSGWPAKKRAEEVLATVAVVNTDNLKVREQPNTDSEVITMVPDGEELDVVEAGDDWVKILIDDEENYVSAEYVDVQEKLNAAITMTELLYGQGVSDIRVDLCQFAKEHVGNPYVWGGTSLTKGADCSGFILSVYKNFGISLPRTSGSQAGAGTKITMAEAKPGDLIFYAKGGRINHVALYIGGGQVVHASSPKTGIKISKYNYRTPAKIVRVLADV